MEQDGQYYWYLTDHLGTPQKLINASGQVVWSAAYEAFGKAHVNPDSVVENNLRFPGQYYDVETGLHYNWHRYYDPVTGRYLTTDPIGLTGGMNLFLYADANPIRFADPSGLLSATGGLGAGGGFQFFGIGANAHYRVECGSGGCFGITTVCGRFGGGMFVGGGAEAGGSIGSSSNQDQDSCEDKPCFQTWSVGIGGDVAFGNEGGGFGVGVGPTGLSASGSYRSPASLGYGFSLGVDICYVKSCPL